MLIDLLKLEQKRIVPLAAIDGPQNSLWYSPCQILLLGECEQAIALDAENERGLFDLRECVIDLFDRCGVVGCWGAAGPRYIVGIEFARHGDVAVCVEALDELVTLIPEVGLCREVGWR